MNAPVPPDRAAPAVTDREAAVQQVAGRFDEFGVMESSADLASVAVDALWPLICQAREDGRREAAEAILASPEGAMQYSKYYPNGLYVQHNKSHYADLARGAQQPGKENPDGQ